MRTRDFPGTLPPFDAVVTIPGGECEVWVPGQTCPIKEGDAIILPADIPMPCQLLKVRDVTDHYQGVRKKGGDDRDGYQCPI